MRPAQLRRLDALMASAMIAHEAIFDMSRELRAQRRMSVEPDDLLWESAQIVTKTLPSMTATVRQLAGKWSERDLLGPPTVAATLKEIEVEMERIRPEIEQLVARQHRIASRLRDLLEE